MALTKGVNSYVTVEEADTYFSDRLDSSYWTSATSTRKVQALIGATSYLDDLKWIGVAISDSQSLSFPREGTYFDPRMGTEVILDTTVPVRVITATYELAYHFLVNNNILDDTGSVFNLSVGDISLSNIRKPSKLNPFVKRLIAPLLENGGNSVWWRAN